MKAYKNTAECGSDHGTQDTPEPPQDRSLGDIAAPSHGDLPATFPSVGTGTAMFLRRLSAAISVGNSLKL